MLVNQDWVTVGIDHGDVAGARAVGGRLGREGDAGGFEVVLDFAHVFEFGERFSLAVPAGIEGETVLFEHALKEADGGLAVAQDQPVLGDVATGGGEAKFFVEGERSGDVFDRETD